MAAPNIATATTITCKTAIQAVGTGPTTIVASQTNAVVRVNTLVVANIDGTVSADVTLDLYRSGTPTRLGYLLTVNPKSSLTLLGKDSPLYLEEGDLLRLSASVASKLEAVASYEVLS
jgi:hypothetical protein